VGLDRADDVLDQTLYADDPATLDATLGKAAKEASDELSAIALRYAVIDGKELAVAKEAAHTHPLKTEGATAGT
jgi:hypothetical protein